MSSEDMDSNLSESESSSDHQFYDHLELSEYQYYTKFTRTLLWKGFKYTGAGSFRRAYERKNIIIKVPVTRDGIIDNYMEFRAWRKYKNNPTSLGILLAPCRLLSNYCLLMPKVEREYSFDGMPDWASNIDNEQVGYHRGKLVAYDYAIDLEERLKWEMDLNIKNSFFQRSYIHRTFRDYLNVIKG